MAQVWMARRGAMAGASKTVALKLLAPECAKQPEQREMFLSEARLSMLLSNSNIVQVFDAGSSDGVSYLAMEWVEGLDLAALEQRLRRLGQPMPITVAAFIVGEILKALSYAHCIRHQGETLTIVHRDISPHNVMISVAGEVKLMDFGIARVASEDTTGMYIKGKLRYMPPEQLARETREPTTDLFAVGAILHELLEGRTFRDGVDQAQLWQLAFAGEAPPFRPPEPVPPELDALRVGLLAPKPEDRIPTARAAYQALARWPGYRDAKFELEEIVRCCIAADIPEPSPRATEILTDTARAPMTEAETSVTELLAHGGLRAGDRDDTGATATELLPELGDPTELIPQPFAGDTIREPAPLEPRPSARWVLGGVLAGVAAVAIVVTTLALVRRSSSPDQAVREPADVELLDAPEVADAPSFDVPPTEPIQPVASPPPPDLGVEDTPKPHLAPDGDEAGDRETFDRGTPEPPEASRRPIKVTLSAPSHGVTAQIKIASRVVTIDKFVSESTATWLPPGRYAIAYRSGTRGRWLDAGEVRIGDRHASLVIDKRGVAKLVD